MEWYCMRGAVLYAFSGSDCMPRVTMFSKSIWGSGAYDGKELKHIGADMNS
jgi:hypothetical protein